MARAGGQLEIVKKKSKKEKGKALVEPKFAPMNGKKSKRARCTKDQVVVDTLVKAIELSLNARHTPSQKLLKFTGIIPKEEEEVAMGMDNPNDPYYDEKEIPHEEKPLYEEGPLELGVKTPHIASFATFNITPPQEVDKEDEGGDKKEENAAMDEANEEERKKVKLKVGDPTQSILHLKKGVPPNIPHGNYTMKEGVRRKGKGKGI
jgi:hypothetical protein